MIKLNQVGALLLMAGLLIACSAPAAPKPPSAATQAPVTQPAATLPAAAPETPTAAAVASTAPANAPAPETGVGTSEEPTALPGTGMAVVENVDVRILESFPVQVQAVVTGYLPDGCTTITAVEAVNEGTTFRIHITTNRLAEAMCTMAIVNFEQVVPLDVADLPAGTYQVVVNDLSMDFELPVGGAEAAPQPEAGGYPIVETATGYVLAQVDVPIYDAPMADGTEIGLIAGGQMARVTGASPDGAWWRVICPDDTIGDCWVTADPDVTVPTTPPN